jgi:uncharacterized OB-fold protein
VTRPIPTLTPETAPFFTGGRDGKLLIYRCRDCKYWSHPPVPRCPACLSAEVGPEPSSGRGTVASFTVNWHPWHAAFPPPYVIALVELDEQPGLRLTTNLVNCTVGDVGVGMPVLVSFEPVGDTGDIYLPVFEPEAGAQEAGR